MSTRRGHRQLAQVFGLLPGVNSNIYNSHGYMQDRDNLALPVELRSVYQWSHYNPTESSSYRRQGRPCVLANVFQACIKSHNESDIAQDASTIASEAKTCLAPLLAPIPESESVKVLIQEMTTETTNIQTRWR